MLAIIFCNQTQLSVPPFQFKCFWSEADRLAWLHQCYTQSHTASIALQSNSDTWIVIFQNWCHNNYSFKAIKNSLVLLSSTRMKSLAHNIGNIFLPVYTNSRIRAGALQKGISGGTSDFDFHTLVRRSGNPDGRSSASPADFTVVRILDSQIWQLWTQTNR